MQVTGVIALILLLLIAPDLKSNSDFLLGHWSPMGMGCYRDIGNRHFYG
jgi:hypothetical protein